MSEKELSLEKAIELGEQGDFDTQYALYKYFSKIEGKDKETIYWLTKCAESGDHDCEALLGYDYYLGVHTKNPNYGMAVHWLEKSKEGSYLGLAPLGECYLFGHGKTKDVIKAIDLFNQALDNDPEEDEALEMLGYIFLYGIDGVPKDLRKARKYLSKATQLGNDDAKLDLANLIIIEEQDYKKAFELFKEVADTGDEFAQQKVGSFLVLGKGINKNVEEGIKWLEKSAEQDYEPSMLNLYNIYRDGKFVPVDKAKSEYWVTRGAELGYSDSINVLMGIFLSKNDIKSLSGWIDKNGSKIDTDIITIVAFYYQIGEYVEKNIDKAIKYYTIAAKRGDVDSMVDLGDIYSDEDDKDHFNVDNAIKYLTMAYNRDNNIDIEEILWMALLYYEYKKDIEKAEEWLLIAKEKGSMDALGGLGELSFENKKFNEARKYYEELVKRKSKDKDLMKEANYHLATILGSHKNNISDQFMAKDYLESAIYYGQEDETNLMDELDEKLKVDDTENNKVVVIVKELIDKNVVPAALPAEADLRIKEIFGDSYGSLEKNTKSFLRTSLLNFYRDEQLGVYDEDQDYSYLVNSLGKAVESELKEIFHIQYLKHLKENKIPPSSFKAGSQKFVTVDKATNKVCYVEEYDEGAFSLGAVRSHIGLVPYKEVNKYFLDYFKTIVKDKSFKDDKEIISYLSNFVIHFVNHFAFNLRNPASHPSAIMPKWKAIHCANLLFVKGNPLVNLLNRIKPEYLSKEDDIE